jgi:hypothetical protein
MPTPPSDSTVHGTDTGFVGRKDVLAEVDRQLAAISSGWVLIIGGPGTGKSAILSEYLVRRDRAPDRADIPRHFIRRNTHGSQPHVIISALAAQLERRFSAQRTPDAEPATRLVELLTRISHEVLVPRGEHLDIVVDGLNEVDADAASTPLPRFLPAPLPSHVRFLGTTRPEQPHLDWLLRQRGVRWIDLDTTWAASNHDTVRLYWSTAAAELQLTTDTVNQLVTAADGNILHAVMVRDAIESPPPGWSLDRLPPGLVGLVRELWERCVTDAPRRGGAGAPVRGARGLAAGAGR